MRKLLNRYGLTRLPFSKELDPADLLDFAHTKDLLQRLKAAVEGKASAVLTGEAGVGKTCLLRALEGKLHPSRYRMTYIHNTGVSRGDFYRQLSTALGLEPKGTAASLFRQVQQQVEDLADEQKIHPVLVIDEAHLLPLSVLEHLHVLLNYRKDSRSFLSLLLVGLPELRNRLSRNVLSSLSTRLPVRIHLDPVDQEMHAYLKHRMNTSGCEHEVFSEEAVLCIREATGGVLRKIDILGQACLEVASEGQGTLVDGNTVQDAVRRCAEALR